jgi:ubiquinone/menaquinone biosynthesis C-methylase UbiE
MNLLDSLFARVYDPMMAGIEERGLAEQRRQLVGSVSGDVLEIGAGTGLNLPAYPEHLKSLTLTEPSPPMASRLRARVAQERPDATVVDAGVHDLPFEDDSFDAVVSTLVLCSVGDQNSALAQIRRVLRPGGQLVLIEHVATDGLTGTAQRIFNPVQHVMGRGCDLTKDTRAAVAAAGFDVGGVVPSTMKGAPPVVRSVIAGVATAP